MMAPPRSTSTTGARPSDEPAVAVYRRRFLPPSETFVRDHLLHQPRYRGVAVAEELLPDGPGLGLVPHLPVADPWHHRAARRVLRTARARQPQAHVARLAGALRATGAVVAHAHFGVDGARLLGAARRTRLPLVVTFHGYDATTRHEVLRESAEGRVLVEHWHEVLHTVDAVIAVSRFIRDALERRGADPGRIVVIPCGVDTRRYDCSPPPAGGPVLFVGRLVEKKGVGDLLRAAAAAPGIPPLIIVGDGPLKPSLQALAASLRVDARFLGVQDSGQVRVWMQRASLVAMPSKQAASGDCEGLPVTALEASASGRAVVGYRHSGIGDAVIHGATGLLATEGDVRGLAECLERLSGDRWSGEQMGRRGRQHVEARFQQADKLAEVADLYDRVRAARAELGTRRRGTGR